MLHRYHPSLLLLACLGIVAPASAQISSSANATTTVVDPAVIATLSDLDFGAISPAASGSTVIVTPHESTGDSGASASVEKSGEQSDAKSVAKASPAIIAIGGASGQSYSITLPKESHLLKQENGHETVAVEAFTADIPEGLLLSGEQTIRLGATLSMNEGQAPGRYTAPSGFPVIVNYN